MGQDDGRLSAPLILPRPCKGILQGLRVVAVAAHRVPAEIPPLGLEGLQPQGSVHKVQALHMIVIHDGGQPVQAELGRLQRALPDLALVAFPVAQHHEGAPGGSVHFRAQRKSRPDRQAVAERTGGHLHPGDPPMADMSAEPGTVLVVGFQFLDRKEAPLRQRGINGAARVPLAQDHAVPLRPGGILRIHAQNGGIQHGDNLRRAENAADMAPPA